MVREIRSPEFAHPSSSNFHSRLVQAADDALRDFNLVPLNNLIAETREGVILVGHNGRNTRVRSVKFNGSDTTIIVKADGRDSSIVLPVSSISSAFFPAESE